MSDGLERVLRKAARRFAEYVYEEDLPDPVEDGVAVADEAEDVAAHVDVSDIVDAIDVEELPDVTDADSVAEAIESGEFSDAVHLRELVDAIDFTKLASSANLRGLWREGREFNEAVEEFDLEDEAADADTDDVEDVEEVDDEAMGALGDADMEAVQRGVQSQMMDAVTEFREGLLEVHAELNQLYEENRAASEKRRGEQPDSRNPTAVSTMSRSGPLGSSVRQGSTVPRETRYSEAPNNRRIYGDRFEEEPDD